MCNIQPLGKRVLLKRHEAETTTTSGILLVESAQEQKNEAKVIALGDEVPDNKLSVDDVVLLSRYGGTEVKDGGETYLVTDYDDILCIMG